MLNQYTTARKLMFTQVERRPSENGGPYLLHCVYTDTTAPAPQTADPNGDLMNAEHLWPRSQMTNEASRPILYSHQESDIHNLYPTIPRANSARNSVPGTVFTVTNDEFAPSRLGKTGLGWF